MSMRSTAVSTFGFGAGIGCEGGFASTRGAGAVAGAAAGFGAGEAGAGFAPGRERIPESVCSSFRLIPGSVPTGAPGRAFSSASTPEMTSEKMSSEERSGCAPAAEKGSAAPPPRAEEISPRRASSENGFSRIPLAPSRAASAFLSFPLYPEAIRRIGGVAPRPCIPRITSRVRSFGRTVEIRTRSGFARL